MKHISEIKPGQIGKARQPNSNERQSAQIINLVFSKLKAISPAWKSAMPTVDVENAAKAEWLIGLVESKITSKEQLERGFRGARLSQSPFFPSCGQFIMWCKPNPRENERMYQAYAPALPEHTSDEYKKFAEDGLRKIREAGL